MHVCSCGIFKQWAEKKTQVSLKEIMAWIYCGESVEKNAFRFFGRKLWVGWQNISKKFTHLFPIPLYFQLFSPTTSRNWYIIVRLIRFFYYEGVFFYLFCLFFFFSFGYLGEKEKWIFFSWLAYIHFAKIGLFFSSWNGIDKNKNFCKKYHDIVYDFDLLLLNAFKVGTRSLTRDRLTLPWTWPCF